MHRRLIHAVLCSLLAAAAPAAVHAVCPAGFVSLDLKTGAVSISPALIPYFSYVNNGAPIPAPAVAGCPAAAGWKMAALKIVIPPGQGTPPDPNACTQANIVVGYEGTPSLWTVNLGDSPTNDGFGGDAGTTAHDAELWVLGENLSLTNGGDNPSGLNNPQVFQHLSLTNGTVKFVVKNQFVSWGQPYGFAQAPATQDLFAIPDTTALEIDQRAIFLGLNRVIVNRLDRTGCGARNVLISFQ